MESETSLPTFDYSFAGASVIKISRYLLTASSIQQTDVDGEMKPFVKIRVNQQKERMKLFEGDIMTLSDTEKYKVVSIVAPESRLDRGKIYLAEMNEEEA